MKDQDEYVLTNETFYSSRDIVNTCLREDAKKLVILSYEKEGRETGETEFYFSALDFKYFDKAPKRRKEVRNRTGQNNLAILLGEDAEVR